MSPSELKRHVATLCRVLALLEDEQADNARYIARHAGDVDELGEWLHEEGGYGDAVWTEVDAVMRAVEQVATKYGLRRLGLEMRNGLRAFDAINDEFALRLSTPRNAIRPPSRPSLVVFKGGLAPQSTLVAAPDGTAVVAFPALTIVRTDTVPAPSGKRSA